MEATERILVSGIGGFTNYAPGFGSPILAAYDSMGNLLESYDLSVDAPISTPAAINAGAFRGILRPTADIKFFTLSNAYIAADDIAPAASPMSRNRVRLLQAFPCSARLPLASSAAANWRADSRADAKRRTETALFCVREVTPRPSARRFPFTGGFQ